MTALVGVTGAAAWTPLPKQAVALACDAYELLYGGAKGGGKDLSSASLVPTPDGWKRHGDLTAGDRVFAPDGTVTTVLGNTGTLPPRQLYRVSFSDGTSIVCSGTHLWNTYTFKDRRALERRTPEWRAKRRASRKGRGTGARPDLAARNAARAAASVLLTPPEPSPRTTDEIRESLRTTDKLAALNHSIEAIAPVFGEESDLPVPPYTMGAWLGDGTSAAGDLTGVDEELFDRVAADGFTVTRRACPISRGVIGLKGRLRAAGVLGDKHIPLQYKRASIRQRLELVRGMMDTDGWCDPDGSCHLLFTDSRLFGDAVEVLRSLGIVVHVSSGVAHATNGKDGNASPYQRATFVTSLDVFTLPRKRERQKRDPQVRYTRRFIESVEPVDWEPTNCIQVDRSDGLYVVGDQWVTTHNSHFLVGCFLDILWAAHVRYQQTGKQQMRCRIPIFRRNIKDLNDIIVKSHDVYPAFDPGADFHKVDRVWTFASGARVEFCHLDGPDDFRAWNGQEIIAAGYDQVEEIPEEQYAFINANIRTGDPYYKPYHRVRCTANPGGRHGDWVKRRFIDPHPAGGVKLEEKVTVGGKTMTVTRAYIPSKLKDNKYLAGDGTYEAKLRATLPEHMVQRLLEGDWDVIDGAFFASRVRPDAVFVHSKDVKLNDGWDVTFGLDWGASNPACTLWAAYDDAEDRVVFFDELYTPGISGGAYAEHMLDKVRGQQWSRTRRWAVHDFYGLIDKQAFDSYMGGASAGEIIEQHGFRLFPANKDRKLGIAQILERLQVRADGQAGVVIMEDRCPNLKRALMSVSVDKVDQEDYDKRHNMAHAVDAMRFVLVNWPVSRKERVEPLDADVARFNEYLRRAKAKAPEHGSGGGYS